MPAVVFFGGTVCSPALTKVMDVLGGGSCFALSTQDVHVDKKLTKLNFTIVLVGKGIAPSMKVIISLSPV